MATATQSIREIIDHQPTAAAILQRFEIDVCSHADKPLGEACADLQLSVEQVLEKLEDEEAGSGTERAHLSGLAPSRLIQHIVRVHHQRVRRDLPRLAELAHTVARTQRKRAPKLELIAALVDRLKADLLEHIRKEEQVLFPYITQVDQAPLLAFRPPQACFKTVGQPVLMMVQEHESAVSALDELRKQSHGFEVPEGACASLEALYAGLREFDDDLRKHLYLENELLFPRAIEMENRLNAGR